MREKEKIQSFQGLMNILQILLVLTLTYVILKSVNFSVSETFTGTN